MFWSCISARSLSLAILAASLPFLAAKPFLTANARGEEPQETTEATSAEAVGAEAVSLDAVDSPESIEAFPSQFTLDAPRRQLRLVVTGKYADGSVRDLTREAEYSVADPLVLALDGAVAKPLANGQTQIFVRAGVKDTAVPVTVADLETPKPISFSYEALTALSKQGCNSGACHGSPSGKGGFRLSLRAFDPVLDELTLVREEYGRRTNPLEPDSSLLLAKPAMRVPHGGGQKIRESDPAYALLRDWIAEGCQIDTTSAAKCVKVEVFPPSGRVLKAPAFTQQLVVLAHFADGAVRDITPMAVFSSSDENVARVDVNGLVTADDRGEVAIVVRYLEHLETTFLTFVKDVPGFVWNSPAANNYIDEHVHEKLQQLQFLPSETCTDEEFLRRVSLDVIGALPTIEETERFLADASPDKRAKLIDSLLERPEYARFWALKWGDLLKLTTAQVTESGLYKYHRWVERALAANMPYDRFAEELLTSSGSTLENPAANFFRTSADANELVENVAQIFLGARLQCAKCHNHPFERWTQDNYYGMAAFFNRVQKQKSSRADELVIWTTHSGEVTQPRTGKQMKPWLPLAGDVQDDSGPDRRDLFAAWLTQPDNPFFAKVEVNRLWGHLFGRGIVEPVDDFRESNPPANAPLLEALAKDFAASGFDRKHMLRTILNSRAYQASSRVNEFNQSDEKYASHFQPRLLGAEQLLDAICHVTQVAESFGSLPPGTKAAALPSPEIAKSDFLKTFGQPERQTVCACERSNESSLGQALQLYNGPLVHGKLRSESNRFRQLLTAEKTDAEIVIVLYKAALCREPGAAELEASLAHIASKENRVEALEDVCWAVLNMNEFLFQH
jgi:hypothetical protein